MSAVAKARRWQDVRAEATARGVVTEEGVAEARRAHEERERAYRLQRVRKDRRVRQEDLAEQMGVSQSRVSRIESGDLEHVEIATLRAYIHALGGELRVVADFDGDQMKLA